MGLQLNDNGTQFISDQFNQMCQEYGIQHMQTAPYSPQSNGQAEHFVDTFKRALKKLRNEEDIFEALQTYLWSSRSTPMKGRKTSPAEEMVGRKIRVQMDLMKPTPPIPREK